VSKITTVGSPPRGVSVEPQGEAKGPTARLANLHKVAKEFETLMVHQLLEAAKLGGDEKDSGYKGMVVDAAASGVSLGGGLGLARQIEEALGRGR
jgi:Rod binding domain-containing protein